MGIRFIRLFFGTYGVLVPTFVGTAALALGFFIEGQWFRWGCWIALVLAFLYTPYLVWRRQVIGSLANDGARVVKFFEEVRVDCGAETRLDENPMRETGRPLDYGITANREPFYAEKQLIRLKHQLSLHIEKSNVELGSASSLKLVIDRKATTNELKTALDAHVQKLEIARNSLWLSIE
jgi:hypothetical protein